jgi:hypothetical protein
MTGNRCEAETMWRLQLALFRMTRRQRRIFLAVRIDDLSYAEIAERTGLTIGDVEREFAAGLRLICVALDGRLPGPLWRRLWQRLATARYVAALHKTGRS